MARVCRGRDIACTLIDQWRFHVIVRLVLDRVEFFYFYFYFLKGQGGAHLIHSKWPKSARRITKFFKDFTVVYIAKSKKSHQASPIDRVE